MDEPKTTYWTMGFQVEALGTVHLGAHMILCRENIGLCPFLSQTRVELKQFWYLR